MNTQQPRSAYTLIELLVVISLIAVLAALTMAFFPSFAASAKESRAGMNLQGWLNVAKQRALRDQAPRGLRLWQSAADPTQVIDCQYLEQPDDFTGGQIISALLIPPPAALLGYSTLNTLRLGGADFTSGYGVGNPPLADPNMKYWAVQPGDFVQVLGSGLMHRIIQVGMPNGGGIIQPNYIKIDPPLPYTINTPTPNYRIVRTPRPTGDEMLKMPEGTVIDLATNINFGNQLPVPPNFQGILVQGFGFVDIMFGPSGAVISSGVTTSNINLWVRALDPSNPLDPYRGDPTIVSVFVKTGFVGAFNPAPTTHPQGVYAFVY